MSGIEGDRPLGQGPVRPEQGPPPGYGTPPTSPPTPPTFPPAQSYPPAHRPNVDTPLTTVSVEPGAEQADRAGTGAGTGAGEHSMPTARRRRRAPVVATVLAVLLVAALGGGAYLAVLSNQWHERSGEWESESRTLGEKVANLTTDLSGMTAELTQTREQLTTAQTRITELADEKAQVGDDRESQKILASDIQAVAQEALNVSAALGDCISAQNTALGYLTVPDSATPEQLQTSIDQSNSVCSAAIADYNALQQDLAAQ